MILKDDPTSDCGGDFNVTLKGVHIGITSMVVTTSSSEMQLDSSRRQMTEDVVVQAQLEVAVWRDRDVRVIVSCLSKCLIQKI